MRDISRRVEKIEKELAIEDKTQWLRLPDHDNPGQFIEFKGCRTFTDLTVRADEVRKRIEARQRLQNETKGNNKPKCDSAEGQTA